MIINVADWFAYCSWEGGTRQADNTGTGAENILDLSGPIAGEAHGAMVVTATGREYLPSLNAIAVDRPVSLSAVVDPWEVAAIFGENADGTHADPVVIHNTETDGYFVSINQAGAGNWIDDRGLTCAEFIGNWVVEQGLLGRGNPYARSPDPKNGATLADTWYYMSWSPGVFAVSHDVYFGENFDDVNDGTPGSSGFCVNQDTTMLFVGFTGYPYPDGLVPGTTYYWRIDEVNDTDPNSPWKGHVWSFWIPPRTAYNPKPADGVKFVDPNAELSWTAGLGASFHYVYFGDNFDDVNSAVEGLFLVDTTYTPGTLEVDKTYYWRVDESPDNVNMLKGDVWSFKTLPDVEITDPNLVGWWTLDEGSGTTAVDWSGRGNHGTLVGDPQWVDGYDGGALQCDGGDWVTTGLMPADYGLDGANAKTVTAWVYTTGFNNGGIFDMGSQSNSQEYCLRTMTTANQWRIQFWGVLGVDDLDFTYPTLNQWVHFGLTYDGTSCKAYANGQYLTGFSPVLNITNNAFVIGRYGSGTGFDGIIDDVRLFNKALTQEEVMDTMRGDPLLAGAPKPDNWSTPYIREATPLNWSPGDKAFQHDVYFGIDKDAVADANASDTTGVYRGQQVGTSYTPPDVEWGGGPYYWRIDEYNTDATIGEGKIWSFTVADFIGIEDFEDYNDFEPDRIFDTWMDGWGVDTNGAEVGYADPNFNQGEHHVETTIVHGGSQSMPYFYDNNFKYSEATYSPTQRDWTEEGVGVLSLWFCGAASNAAESMYVSLNGSAAVYLDDPVATQVNTWTEWTIDLQTFAAQGVNLTNVNTLAIGFGDVSNLQAGGTGMVFFDDIRLYRQAPSEPEPEKEPAP
ncbi:hypothetical protein ES705_13974 [subsurface metagenome]